MALIITPNYEVTPIEPENGKFTLEQLQSIVEGYIEIVHIGEKELMVVNEEGLLRNMKVNDVATTYLNIRKLTILLFSMENFFKRTAEDRKRKCDVFQIWEERNRMDWNEWYHTQADLLEEEINGYSFEYTDKSKHGWCL